MFSIYSLSLRLKEAKVLMFLIHVGNLFQARGPLTEKAFAPVSVAVLGTKRLLSDLVTTGSSRTSLTVGSEKSQSGKR